MDKKVVKEIIKKIKQYDTIVIHRHIRPDGDCIGATLGLREVLRDSFPNKKIYSVGKDVPEYLEFLGKEDEVDDSVYQNALAIVVDSSVSDRTYDERFKNAKEIIKIDHHIPVDQFANINYVNENIGAACLLIAEMFMEFPKVFKVSSKAAQYLYLGVVTDTGRFKFGTDGDSLRITAFLLDKNVDTELLYTHLYTKEAISYKFTGWVYNNFKISENGVASIYITKDIKRELSISNEDASNTVNTLDSIKGSMIWVLFNEQDEEIRVRLRSRFVPIVDIASKYNGGGHVNAAGATVYTIEEANNLLNELDLLLKEYKEKNEDKF